MQASTASDLAMLRRVICSGICISVILRSRDGIFGRLAGIRVDPAGDADFVLGLFQGLAGLVIALVVGRLHVGDRFKEGGEGTVIALAVLAMPIEAVRTLDDAGAVVFRSARRNGATHGKSSVDLFARASQRAQRIAASA